MKFLWACRTFDGDNDVETFVRHFEIHWGERIVTIDDEDKEAQYGCCTFQTLWVKENQAPVELAPAYKNMWANRWSSCWFYATILVIGKDSKQEEVTTYNLACLMVDLDVDLAPELTRASTYAYFQDTHM
jgi:hypothetical protein